MSGSDHYTTAYFSTESSIKTLSTTLADNVPNGEQSPANADAVMASSQRGNASAEDINPLSRATTAAPSNLLLERASEEDRFLETGPRTSSSSRSAATTPVVDRREISVADISLMRLEGCRTHRLTPNTSLHASLYGGAQLETPQVPPLRRVSAASSRHVDAEEVASAGSVARDSAVLRRSGVTTPGATALDTSVAILQHMANDTAARVVASRTGQTPFPSSSLAALPVSSSSPPPVPCTQHRTAVPSMPAGDHLARESTTDPIGFALDGDSDVPASQPHTGSTQQYRRSSTPTSPLHSLSDSELCGAQVRPLGASRNVSAQALSRLGEESAHTAAAADTPDGAKRRLRLAGANTAVDGGEGEERTGRCEAAAVLAAAVLARPASGCLAASPMGDASVYNHDFQRIISHEVKEALTRNMRPSIDDDEDEDDTLLNDVLRPQVVLAAPSTATAARKRDTAAPGQSHNSAFAPFQLPMGATSIGRLDSVVGSPSIGPTTRAAVAPFGPRPSDQPLSLSTAALEGTSPTLTHGGSTATSATASRGSKNVTPRAVSAQAWRFPTLGKASAGPSTATRESSFDEAEEAGGAEAGGTKNSTAHTSTGGAASSSRRTHRTALPHSDPTSDPAQEVTTPLSDSWQQRRGSDVHPGGRGDGLRSTSRRDGPTASSTNANNGPAAPASGAAHARGHSSGVPLMVDAGVASHARTGAVAAAASSSAAAASGGGSGRNGGGGGAGGAGTSMMRYEDGRLYTQQLVSTTSSSSLPGSGGAAPDDSYPRKLEMMHTVYERLASKRRGATTPKAAKDILSRKSARIPIDSNFPVTPHVGQLGQQPPPPSQSQQHASSLPAEAAPSSGLSSHVRRSPSLSCSGALGRSAGYYSFGTRVSLSHPNRQTLPQQYLGSSSALVHGTPSPRTTVLGSPAVVDLVVGSNGSGVLSTGATLSPGAPENSLTHPTSSTTRVGRRSLNSVLLRRIEARPLLQLTLFLKHTFRAAREAHGGRALHTEASRESDTTSQLALSGATAVPSAQPDLSRFTDSAGADPALRQSGNEHLASMATPLGSVANVASDDRELSSNNTRGGASSGSSRSSFIDRAGLAMTVSKKSSGNTADGSAGSFAASSPAAGSTDRKHAPAHVDPHHGVNDTLANGAAVAVESHHDDASMHEGAAYSNGGAGAGSAAVAPAHTPKKHEGGGNTAQRYYRALTEAEQCVRHVHGVDGVEREVDNESMDLIVYVGMRLLGWLEVVSLLGCGSFGQVFLCKDLRICDGHFVHPSEIGGVDYEYWNCSHAFLPFSSVDIPPTNPPLVAVKVVKSVPLLEQQSVLEAEMLVLIGAQTAAPAQGMESCNAPPPEDPRCASVAKVLADGVCYGHHCIVMERYGANLYEYIAANEHLGLPMYQIRSIGRQLFTALSLIHEECHIIHADIKPENMLLTLDSSRGTVRTNEAAPPSVPAAARSPEPRDVSPPAMPPRHAPRTENSISASATCSPERSYITLRTGLSNTAAAAGRQRHGQLSRRPSGVPLDASSSTLSRGKGQSFCHLRSSVSSRLTVVEPSSVPTPEPRRVQALNQSAGMLSARTHSSTSSADSTAVAAATGRGAPSTASPSSMIPRLHVKLIDFSSSCYDGGPFYQYIQSRYYRAPEVIVGAAYNAGIDIWSSGCMLAELLLGMPLLPGCNDHHQLCLIEEMVGQLPTSMIEEGANTELYYRHLQPGELAPAGTPPAPTTSNDSGTAAPCALHPQRPYALRTREDYLHITQNEPLPYRRYFTYQTLQELVRHCPLTLEERRMSNGLQPYVPVNESSEIPANATPSPSVRSEMMKQRFLLFDLLRRLLQTDAAQRPTASQVLTHPFFTSAPPYMKTFALE